MKYTTYIQGIAVLLLLAGPAWADDFADMLEDVNQNHPALKAQREALNATKEGVTEAYTGFLPSASTEYDLGRQRIKYNALPHQFEDTATKQLTVTQPIFNGGGTVAQLRGAKARSRGGDAHLKQVQQQVLLDAIAAYVDIVEKQEVLAMAQDNVAALGKHLSATRKQFKAGELTITDVAQSQARLARAKAELHDAQAAVADAHDAYVRQVGKQPTAHGFPRLPAPLPATPDEIETTVAQHPAVIEAQENEKVADYAVDERVSAVLPNVRLQGQLSNNKGSTTPSIFTTDDRSVMVRVSIPISTTDYPRIQEARYQYRRARNDTLDVTRDTLKTALREWNNYTAAGAAITEHEEAVAAGKKALDSVTTEQRAGTRTVLDVLNAQDEMYGAEVSLVRAQSRQVLSAYRLLAAMGVLDEHLPRPSA